MLVAALALFWIPAPSSLRTEGVIRAPEHAHVRVAAEGFVVRTAARLNQAVRAGEPLLVAENIDAVVAAELLQAQFVETQAQHDAVFRTDLVRASVLREQMQLIATRLEQARARVLDLVLASPSAGVFIMPEIENAPGKFLRRGELLGYVTDFSGLALRVIVPQSDVDRVRSRVQRVEVRPIQHVAEVVTTRILREVPGATDELPSLSLSQAGGGGVGLDPTRPGEARAIESLFLFEVELPPTHLVRTLGSRYHVRFVYDAEPLGVQWARELRGLLLKRFAT